MENLEEFIKSINNYSDPYLKGFHKCLKEQEQEVLPFIQTAGYIVGILETKFAVQFPKLNEEKFQDKLMISIAIVFMNAVSIKEPTALNLKKQIEKSIGIDD